MSRRTAVAVLALAPNPALLHAQESTLTVTVASADVYKDRRRRRRLIVDC